MKITKKKLKQIIKETIEEQQEGGLVNINAGPQHVLQVVPKLLSNPKLKDIIRSGQTDAAGPGDEVIEIRDGTRLASKLSPTQSQIGADQSLNDQAAAKFGNLDRAIKGGKLASAGGEFPILVFKNWVLDGHHRWSQFVATNPCATVNVAEIVAPGVRDEKTALALLHYMNFALFGKSPTKDFKGTNLYTMNAQQIKDQALKNMSEETPKKLFAAKLIAEPTAEAAANHFANNLSKINGPGKYPRLVMPQPGDSGSKDGYATTPKAAAAGAVNYIAPSPQDLKEGTKKMKITREELNKIIQEETGKIVNEGFFGKMFGTHNKEAHLEMLTVLEFLDEIEKTCKDVNVCREAWWAHDERGYYTKRKGADGTEYWDQLPDYAKKSESPAKIMSHTLYLLRARLERARKTTGNKEQVAAFDEQLRRILQMHAIARAMTEDDQEKEEIIAQQKAWEKKMAQWKSDEKSRKLGLRYAKKEKAEREAEERARHRKDKDVDWDLSRHEGKFTKADIKRLVKETIKGLNK